MLLYCSCDTSTSSCDSTVWDKCMGAWAMAPPIIGSGPQYDVFSARAKKKSGNLELRGKPWKTDIFPDAHAQQDDE